MNFTRKVQSMFYVWYDEIQVFLLHTIWSHGTPQHVKTILRYSQMLHVTIHYVTHTTCLFVENETERKKQNNKTQNKIEKQTENPTAKNKRVSLKWMTRGAQKRKNNTFFVGSTAVRRRNLLRGSCVSWFRNSLHHRI